MQPTVCELARHARSVLIPPCSATSLNRSLSAGLRSLR
ncbi:MAG: hypothetical protein AVDCRST_MAG18-2250 [uncultured Thermomicrobiales bacterium]|uniref:Uncharacterized protein n=1 Tax=uncultured Thermomicrobiales bacterium TaxID=1645740 RepID=A0A6J4VER6_9BACT|nr:MAG: hypothetical protein AVDCRST_MAG18-2250 [uncultured Thermomicrobiales bacterium]